MTNRGRHKNSINSTFRQLRQEYTNTIIRTCSINLGNRETIIYHTYWLNTNVEKVIGKIKTLIYSHAVEQVYIKCVVHKRNFLDTKTFIINLKR